MNPVPVLDTKFEHGFFEMRHPSSWKVDLEVSEDSWRVTLQGPGTAMMIVVSDLEATDDELIEATLEILKEDYPEMEIEGFKGDLCGFPAIGYEVRFFCYDLSNVCKMLATPSEEGTIFLLFQCDDYTIAEIEPVFFAIRNSMKIVTE